METSMRRIAAAMDQGQGSDPWGSADVFLLVDVTPVMPPRRLSEFGNEAADRV